jgi:glycerol uptake facilitator-like aquaporin
MAQTKRRRPRKHRGTQAGTVETRGRTGRPTSTQADAKRISRERRAERFDKPPTWRGAANRAAVATLLFVVVVAVIQKNIAAALLIGILMFFTYTALGYYTDGFMYRRRQAKRAQGKL